MKEEEGKRVSLEYNEAIKYEVVKAVQRGMSYNEACSKYGIKAPSTVYGWVKKGQGAKSRMKSKQSKNREPEILITLSKEKRELELALAKMSLKVYCLETVIEEASKHYQEDLKKKFTQQ
jgi:transposase-like protein